MAAKWFPLVILFVGTPAEWAVSVYSSRVDCEAVKNECRTNNRGITTWLDRNQAILLMVD